MSAERFSRDATVYHTHRVVLVLCAAVVAGALLLEVVPEGRVALRGWEQRPLPHSCSLRAAFNLPCPACGLTRSTIHLVNGRWRESFSTHRLGWLAAAVIVFQFPYRLFALVKKRPAPLGEGAPYRLGVVLLCLFLINWVFELTGHP